MPKMICVDCQVELKIETGGIRVVDMFNNPPQPYRIWSADLWKCPGCGTEIVGGFGSYPLAEHFQPEFAEVLASMTQRVVYAYERVGGGNRGGGVVEPNKWDAILHFLVTCNECGTIFDDYQQPKVADEAAKSHVKETGHEVRSEMRYVSVYYPRETAVKEA